MVYYTLCLGSVNRQKSCWKDFSRRNTDFSEKGLGDNVLSTCAFWNIIFVSFL